MTRTSGFWTTSGTPSGHQVANYTQAHWSTALEILGACAGNEGVAPGYLNELACTSPGSYTTRVQTGGALVDGKWFKNDANYDLTHDSTPSYRTDLIILRASWASFTAELYILKGTDGTYDYPTLTQTSGTTYEIIVADCTVDTGGSVSYDFGIKNWASVGENGIQDSAVTVNKIASDSVDYTKVGNRVPQLYRRQGGSSTIWNTPGTGGYNPSMVRMECGSAAAGTTVTVTFPDAFSYAPVVIIQPYSNDGNDPSAIPVFYISSISTSGFTAKAASVDAEIEALLWLAIGPE